MAIYDLFASHYDAVTGDFSPDATFVDSLIKQAGSGAVTLLEVACGTGGIIAALAGTCQVSGLDISPGMLAVARQKLPAGTPLHEADMTCFRLDAQFDSVVCVYHSINHVLDFSGWESFFDSVHGHLNEGGVFVFDVNTIDNLKMMASTAKYVQRFDDNYLLIRVRTSDEIIFDWNIEVFERRRSGDYGLLTEVIRTVSFPLEQIRDALGKRFTGIRIVDDDGNAVTEDSENRAWFVCTKP